MAPRGRRMSVRQLSTEVRIAVEAGARETKFVMQIGGSVREAIASGHRVFNEVLEIAQRPDREFHAVRTCS